MVKSKIILSLGLIISLIGCGITLFSILGLTNQDIENHRTAQYLDNGGMQDKKKQRKEARMGFIITVLGTVMQVIGTWL